MHERHRWAAGRGFGRLLLSAPLKVLLTASLMAACGGTEPAQLERPAVGDGPVNRATSRPTIITTIQPVDWLVRQLVVDEADVERWPRPSVEQIVSVDTPAVDLLIAHGAGAESWMQTATLPERKVDLASQDLDLMRLEGPTHSHGSEGEHSHRAPDPRSWADPRMMIAEGRRISNALSTLLQASATRIDGRRASLEARLEAAAQAYEGAWRMADEAGARFAQAERAFDYAARAVELDLLTVELDAKVAPSVRQVERLDGWIEQAGSSPDGARAPVLLWTVEPEPAVVDSLSTSLRHLTLDGLAQSAVGSDYDYLEQLSSNVDRLRALASDLGSSTTID